MFIAGMPRRSLRLDQAESSRLAWAFGISVAFHLLLFGGYETGKKLHVWERLHLPAWLTPVKKLAEAVAIKKPVPLQPQTAPLLFVDVRPSQAVAEPPKNTKFYSDRNSLAANPEANKETDMPKITGNQTEVIRTIDAPKEKFVPLQPSPPPPPQPEPPQEEAKPKPLPAPGDLAMAKPSPKPRTEEGEAEKPKPARPRTVKEALAQLPNNSLPGQKMRQDGGVKRTALDPGFDVAASPFGAYDRAFIEAVSQRWFTLLDQRDYASESRGKVVLQFHLHHDGRVSEVTVAENTAGEILGLICQKAVMDPAPFAAWPSDMRRLLGEMRSIQFTFYYN